MVFCILIARKHLSCGKEGFDMAILDWSQCPAVESIPGKVSGAWTFRNSRTPVKLIFENLEDGMTIEEIIEQYPVSREEIKAVLEFAAHSLDTNDL
jgi:uncharacterized protein (DUF433 family)